MFCKHVLTRPASRYGSATSQINKENVSQSSSDKERAVVADTKNVSVRPKTERSRPGGVRKSQTSSRGVNALQKSSSAKLAAQDSSKKGTVRRATQNVPAKTVPAVRKAPSGGLSSLVQQFRNQPRHDEVRPFFEQWF